MASKGRDLGNIVSPQTGIAVTFSGDPVVLGVGNTEHVRITGSGLVGIGTDDPSWGVSTGLIVGDGASARGVTIFSNSANVGDLAFADATSGTGRYRGLIRYDHSDNSLAFRTNSSERLRITSGGDIETIGNNGQSFKFNSNLGVGARNIQIWNSQQQPWHSFVGTNLEWNGTNYVKPSDNSNTNWGNIGGIVFEGSSSSNEPAIRFLVDLPGGNGTDYSLGSSKSAAIDNKTAACIASGGNVGIGTEYPDTQLQIFGSSTTGNLKIGGGNGAGNHRVFISCTETNSYIDSYGNNAYGKLRINAAPLLLNDAGGGSVGIGTDNPSTVLHVFDGSLTLENSSGSGNAWTYYKNVDRTYLVGVRGSSNDALSFYDLTADVERLRITTDGKMGVGTQSPDVLLHLSETNADPYNTVITHLKLNNSGGNGGSGSRIELKTGAARCWIQSFIDGANSNSGGALVFGTPSSGTLGTERLRIHSSGATTMHVNNEDHETFRFTTQGVDEAKLIMKDASDNDDIVLNTGGNSWFNGGNVGINLTNPAYDLDVAGSIRAKGTGPGAGLLLHTNTGLTASANLMQIWSSQSNGFSFHTNGTGDGSNEVMRLTGGGQLNIGGNYTQTTYQLQVDGSIKGDYFTGESLSNRTGYKWGASGMYTLTLGGSRSGNGSSFTMFEIHGMNNSKFFEIMINFGHAGGGIHGSYRRFAGFSNGYTAIQTLENVTANYGGGGGFTISKPDNNTLRVAWNGASSYADAYTLACEFKTSNGNAYFKNVNSSFS